MIPDDVMEVARNVVRQIEAMPSDGNIITVARAIMAERERCREEADEAIYYAAIEARERA